MQKVLTAAQMREVDRLTTERYGIPSIILMENAAHAVARVITEKLGGSVQGKSILILCGKGNNGGDGAALARILGMQGAIVDVLLFAKIKETKGDARINFGVLCREDFEFEDVCMSNFGELREIQSQDECYEFYLHKGQYCDVFVDAIFGIGLTRPLDVWLYNIIHDINFANEGPTLKPRLTVSVDIPTGLNADSGERFAEPVRADVTVTFTAPKPGNILPDVAMFNGELIVADIGSPEELIDAQPSQLYLAEPSDAENWLEETEFSDDSYKNTRGHVLIIAGSESYSGAAVLAGNAAVRSGVGLVTLAAPKECKAEIASRLLPDVILTGIDTDSDSPELLAKTDAIAVGCGLSATDPAIERLVRTIINTRKVPVVIDAGALWFYSPFEANKPNDSEHPLILTPHEGEFMRLLGTDDKAAIKDRVVAVREFATKHGVILVLKGERVLIGAPDGRVVVNPTGNSGLGKAGNGDTLTGILAGFVAQAAKMNIDIFETVVAAVYIAGMAGDVAEKKFGKRVMTASDVRECLVEVFAQFEEN
ncbi:MAG: NAD(P)H-hydrate dehydratase [Pyrinomonadaceae bacterium]